MSEASPQDLAITFRSVPRRRREAKGDAPAEVTAGVERQLDEQLRAAATLMRTTPDATFIADAIDAIRAKEWDDATLGSLREIALRVGALLRELAAVADSGA